MPKCDTTTEEESSMKRVSVRSGGAGHAHSGVVREPDVKDGDIAGAAPDGCATVLRLGGNIVVRLGT